MFERLKRPSPAFREIAARGYGDCFAGCTAAMFVNGAYNLLVHSDTELRSILSTLPPDYLALALVLGSFYTAGATVMHKAVKPAIRSLIHH